MSPIDSNQMRSFVSTSVCETRSSAVAERQREAPCQLKTKKAIIFEHTPVTLFDYLYLRRRLLSCGHDVQRHD